VYFVWLFVSSSLVITAIEPVQNEPKLCKICWQEVLPEKQSSDASSTNYTALQPPNHDTLPLSQPI